MELIQYVDDLGVPTGETEEKLAAHHARTRKHLAFSCYLFNDAGELLVTQRSASKKVWPGVWTNSCCGHPAPGEEMEDAIRRRLREELGITFVANLRCAIIDYSYKTPPYNGIIENEFCPVFIAHTTDAPRPNPAEVDAYKWLSWPAFTTWIAKEPNLFSYWCKDQTKLLIDKL